MIASIAIGNDVWIGTRVIVLHGITIGNRVVVTADLIVIHDLQENTVCAGVHC